MKAKKSNQDFHVRSLSEIQRDKTPIPKPTTQPAPTLTPREEEEITRVIALANQEMRLKVSFFSDLFY